MIQDLLNSIPSDACCPGVNELLHANENELFDLFYKYIDFCLAKDFPSMNVIKTLPGHIENNIFVDRRLVRNNIERMVILGKSDIELNCDGFSVSRIYIKHESVLYVNAKDNSFIVIDALDNSQVHVLKKGNARVIVNLYSNAKETGATKTMIKNRETYDLQVRV